MMIEKIIVSVAFVVILVGVALPVINSAMHARRALKYRHLNVLRSIIYPILNDIYDPRRSLVVSTDRDGATIISDGHAEPLVWPRDDARDKALAHLAKEWEARRQSILARDNIKVTS